MDKRLTEQQRLAIEWLLAGADVKAAAQAAGVTPTTVRYWLRQPAFVQALREAEAEASTDPALQALRAAVGLAKGLRVPGDGEREAKP
jgi:transposase-like protein